MNIPTKVIENKEVMLNYGFKTQERYSVPEITKVLKCDRNEVYKYLSKNDPEKDGLYIKVRKLMELYGTHKTTGWCITQGGVMILCYMLSKNNSIAKNIIDDIIHPKPVITSETSSVPHINVENLSISQLKQIVKEYVQLKEENKKLRNFYKLQKELFNN